ncbi:tRNA glutamyl-Q(34) synthetase GluQRS [Frigidibacter sp. ROC022]|uniref:tRNA glutamyl-Q(34) synthetase GluQRS n=1 Tax=Frigidibacter sp. ROC022 TaxID=2971796 RepID=UPI00215A51F4|nr:tRNA glutamyl-Q(34) synthetase GluQRS [Frigidibacter sp. ROC022]MCR8723954.1 tRNA glutamyl-Q(34) synthetase GluQRS [Frigidibacter sp. ROC022]
MMFRTRFAPSPTGYLHLGHAYSACLAHDMAKAQGGEMLLRIEDTDAGRCRPEYETAILEDLRWLGLDWPEPVRRQSEHLASYASALDKLSALGLTYPCRCTRGDIRAALSAPQEGAGTPDIGPDGPVYPGTCRGRSMAEAQPGNAIRLDMGRALALVAGRAPGFTENGPLHAGRHALDPQALLTGTGDVVLARRDIGTAAYHLAVVVDDVDQGITEVVRGVDLFAATPLHVLLQTLLELPTPSYWHHDLIRDENGKRLAKRDDARAIRRYRAEGVSPAELREMVGLPPP